MSARVAIDLRMADRTGVGRYIRCLASALAQEAREDEGVPWEFIGLANPSQNRDGWPIPVHFYAREIPVYSVREQLCLGRAVDRLPWDLLHIPHFTVPRVASKRPVVSTIHDLAYMDLPGGGRGGWGWRSLLHAWGAAWMLRRAARRSACVITVSEFSRRRIVERLAVPQERVRVIHHGCEHVPAGPASSAREPATLLYVGNHLPHKNLPFLMEVFAGIRRRRPDAALIMAGPHGRHTPAAQEAARRFGVAGHVQWTGGLSDEDLARLYARATVLVFPSRYEGFGLPALEAMAAGLPVAAARAASIPEVVGDSGLLLDPADAELWTRSLLDLLGNPARREELARSGRDRSRRFSWAASARETLRVYQEVLQSNRA